MTIEMKRVTWYSQVIAIVLFVGVFALGFCLGKASGREEAMSNDELNAIAHATYACAGGSSIIATYREGGVSLALSDGRGFEIAQAVSASGARYVTMDEKLVFWNKGTTAFVTEITAQGEKQTYSDCEQVVGLQD